MRCNQPLKFLFIFLIGITTTTLCGQTSKLEETSNANNDKWKVSLFKNIETSTYTNTWQLAMAIDGVNIYYKYSDCSDIQNDFYPENILLKLENTNEYKAYAVWEYAPAYNNVKSKKKETDENLVQVILDPKASEESSCTENQKLRVFVKLKKGKGNQVLTDIIFDNLTIYEI